MIKNLYPDPSEVFDHIINEDAIIQRAESVTKYYDDFIEYAKHNRNNEYKLKEKLYRMLMSINILEGLRFYVSFACTFGFGELRLMEGSAKIISLIARDESQHLAISLHILKNYMNLEKDKVMNEVIKNNEEWVYDTFKQAVDEEKDWAKFLFREGSMIGLSEELLGRYVEFIANKRLRALGLKPVYDIPSTNNPLPWTQHWLSSRGLQNAPQETEVESYIVGGIKQDIKKDEFSTFKL